MTTISQDDYNTGHTFLPLTKAIHYYCPRKLAHSRDLINASCFGLVTRAKGGWEVWESKGKD